MTHITKNCNKVAPGAQNNPAVSERAPDKANTTYTSLPPLQGEEKLKNQILSTSLLKFKRMHFGMHVP